MTIASRLHALLLAASLIHAAPAIAQDEHPTTPPVINLVVAGPVEAGWPESLSAHLSEALWTPVQLRVVADPVPSGTLADVSRMLGIGVPAHPTICVLFGTAVPETEFVACEVDARSHVAVVWGDGLQAPATPSVADATSFKLWRVQKQTTYAAGRLLGVPPCVFPLCVMHADTVLDDVDLKARDLCPPCRQAMRQSRGLAE